MLRILAKIDFSSEVCRGCGEAKWEKLDSSDLCTKIITGQDEVVYQCKSPGCPLDETRNREI